MNTLQRLFDRLVGIALILWITILGFKREELVTNRREEGDFPFLPILGALEPVLHAVAVANIEAVFAYVLFL